MSSVVCVKKELISITPLALVFTSVVCVKLPFKETVPTSVPTPILELVARAFISATPRRTMPPTSAKGASAMEA